MPPFMFELQEDSPMVFQLKLAALIAAKVEGAELVDLKSQDGMMQMTFDKDIRQSLIVRVLEHLVGATA